MIKEIEEFQELDSEDFELPLPDLELDGFDELLLLQEVTNDKAD